MLTQHFQHHCQIINNSAGLRDLITLFNHEQPHTPNTHASTHDFSTLYTKLEHKAIITHTSTILETLFTHIAAYKNTTPGLLRLKINTTTNSFEWVIQVKSNPKLKPNTFLLTHTLLAKWIEILITNTYITHMGKIFKQIIGIPMGTNCAVHLVDLILFTYEYNYLIKQLIKRKYTRIDALRYTRRYLDDITTLNNPDYNDYKYKIYPKHMLTLNEESKGLPFHCLDFHIFYNNDPNPTYNGICSTLPSKRDDPKFKGLRFTRYPHPKSFINQALLYNTVTTELHRYHRIITLRLHFEYQVSDFFNYLINKGYNYNKLFKKLHHFIYNHLPFYQTQQTNTIIQSIKTHVTRRALRQQLHFDNE